MGLDLTKIDWMAVLPHFGVDRRYLSRRHGPCPLPACSGIVTSAGKRSNRDRFRFDNKEGKGTWWCNHCGAGNGFSLLQKFTGHTDREIFVQLERVTGLKCDHVPVAPVKQDDEISPEDAENNRRFLVAAWKRARSLAPRDPVAKYLQMRVPGSDLAYLGREVRFHPGMKFTELNDKEEFVCRGYYPTMLARAVDGTGKPITLHRTYLTPAGTKAPFSVVKKQMAGVRKLRGAAIRLTNVPESRTLGVCEGIETGWAIATAYRYRINVWSLLNCQNLAVADIPDGMFDKVIIFEDNDHVDQAKGYRPGAHFAGLLEQRLRERGIACERRSPSYEGSDFNDMWNEHYKNLLLRAA